MDKVTEKCRSTIMAKVHSKDTGPELMVRRIVHRMGYRFRLHKSDLPGKPDLVFPKLRKVIFVNGCFWHAHRCSHGLRIPVNNRPYWLQKRRRNRLRDITAIKELAEKGWKSLTLWECELRNKTTLAQKIKDFLKNK